VAPAEVNAAESGGLPRTGQARSGKAIVSFNVGANGRAGGLRVDAPSFADTPLPGCVTAQGLRWEFPKSQKGGGQASYPFVSVGSQRRSDPRCRGAIHCALDRGEGAMICALAGPGV
jgi:hypothetical protein